MKRFLFTGILVTVVLLTSSAQSNGEIIARIPVTFPAYDEVKDISWYYDKLSYDNAVQDKSIKYEKITYTSDGLKVIAYVTSQAGKENEKFPVIIFNRGSFIRNDIAYVHAPLFQKLAREGFIVVAPALRQSEGGEGKDELGGADLQDIMNVSPMLKKLHADTSNVFMLGESRGGMMTYMALKKGFTVRAVATVGAITDLAAYVAERPRDENNLKNLWRDYEQNRKTILEDRSVMAWRGAINTPALILHGGNDPQVKPEHALKLAQVFSAQGVSYELRIFYEGNHILSGTATNERDAMVIGWFRKFMAK